MEDDFTNQVDLCSGCIDSQSFSRDRKYIHHHSHSLIRAPFRVHRAEMSNFVEWARDLSQRIKASLKALEAKKVEKSKDQLFDMQAKMLKGHDTEKFITSQPMLTVLRCACCNKDLTHQSLPFWACVVCGEYYIINHHRKKTNSQFDRTRHPFLLVLRYQEYPLRLS